MLKIRLENQVPGSEWAALCESSADSTFFHDPAWLRSLLGSYDYYRPACLVAVDETGHLRGGLPGIHSVRFGLKQLLSLPYGTCGAPLAPDDDAGESRAVRRQLVEAWLSEARRPGIVRAHLVLGGGDTNIAPAVAARHTDEQAFLLDLEAGYDRLWDEAFTGETRTACRKAEKLGVTIAETSGPGKAPTVDAMYRHQAAAWSNHTPFPRDLFRLVLEAAPEKARAWIAELDGEPAAAQLVFHHRDTTLSWIAVNTPAGRRANAQNLLYSRVIQDACRRGSRVFNFGGAGGSASLAAFKASFGAREAMFPTCLIEPAWFKPIHRFQYRLRGIDG